MSFSDPPIKCEPESSGEFDSGQMLVPEVIIEEYENLLNNLPKPKSTLGNPSNSPPSSSSGDLVIDESESVSSSTDLCTLGHDSTDPHFLDHVSTDTVLLDSMTSTSAGNPPVKATKPKKTGNKKKIEMKFDTPIRQVRKKRVVPEEEKTPEYYAKRAKNTASAKASREKRRQKELELVEKYKRTLLLNEAMNKFISQKVKVFGHICPGPPGHRSPDLQK